jgi:hypothetical protein
MVPIKGFDENVRIVHVGSLFKAIDENDWKINVMGFPIQSKKFTRFVHLPMLSRDRLINASKPENVKKDRIIQLKSGYQLEAAFMSEFSELSNYESIVRAESAQRVVCIKQRNQPTIYIPQLELAKAIFLIDSYLCRACLNTNRLSLEFDVRPKTSDGHVDIHVLNTTTFPLKAFDQNGTRMILAWLLTNKTARQSFESIYQHFDKEHQRDQKWIRWIFNFDPPDMTNWKFHVKGKMSHTQQAYLVQEIIGIEIDSEMPSSVKFHHASFVKIKQKEHKPIAGEGDKNWLTREDDLIIDDVESASDENNTIILDDGRAWVSFTKECSVSKNTQEKESRKISDNGEESILTGQHVSTGEPHQGGTLPSADVGGKQDASDKDKLCSSRFQSFIDMLKILEQKYSCNVFDAKTVELPKVGRSRKHLLANGHQRVIKTVKVQTSNVTVRLLEIDTSDGEKMISTKILYGAGNKDWTEDFKAIREGVVSGGLSWPSILLDELYGSKGHKGTNHPKHQGAQAGNIPVDALESWAERVFADIERRR